MITENGIVTTANANIAQVRTIRSSACESCSSKDSCGEAENKKEMIITVTNTLNVKEGDQVVVGLNTGPMLLITSFLYLFPTLLLIIGAFLGNSIGLKYNYNASVCAILTGALFFAISFLIIRQKNAALSKNDKFKPFLVRKTARTMPSACIRS